jgi:hypothetical protein
MCYYASPHHNTATTKRLTLNDAGVCISFSYTAVNTRTAITDLATLETTDVQVVHV